MRRVGEGLDVVDQRRPVVEALDRGERRLQARVAALALERVEQRGLLAADVGAGAAVDDQLHLLAGAEHVLAEEAGLVGLVRPPLEDVGLEVVLAADVDEAAVGTGGARRDAIPSISWCGFFWISSRSLKAPGSDSSALQQRYLSMSPRGRKEAFLPIEKPAPPRPRRPESSSSFRTSSGVICLKAFSIDSVAAELAVGVDRGEVGLVDLAEEQTRLLARPSALDLPARRRPRRLALLRGACRAATSAPDRSCSAAALASSSVSGP